MPGMATVSIGAPIWLAWEIADPAFSAPSLKTTIRREPCVGSALATASADSRFVADSSTVAFACQLDAADEADPIGAATFGLAPKVITADSAPAGAPLSAEFTQVATSSLVPGGMLADLSTTKMALAVDAVVAINGLTTARMIASAARPRKNGTGTGIRPVFTP